MSVWKSIGLSSLVHGVGFALVMGSVFGIPGNPDAKSIPKIYDVFLNAGFRGIPALAILSGVLFYYRHPRVGWSATAVSAAIGIGAITTMLSYYVRK